MAGVDEQLRAPQNILNCSNKALGVGVARGGSYGIYWTQDFGTR